MRGAHVRSTGDHPHRRRRRVLGPDARHRRAGRASSVRSPRLFAVGLALIYRANRIVNFAQGDLGAVPAIFAILLLAKDAKGGAPDWMTGLPTRSPSSLGLIGAIFLGFVVERTIINRFCRAPRLVLTVATIGLSQLLTALALFMPGWFGFKNLDRPTLNPPFDIKVNIGGVFFDANDLMVFLVVPIVLVALALFMRYARSASRSAAAERSDRRPPSAFPSVACRQPVWVITTVLALHHGLLAGRRRRLPDRERARRDRARARSPPSC